MSVFTARPALRWLVPAATALAVIGGSVAFRAVAASAEPSLPPRTAAQLLVDLQSAQLDGLSGTVAQRADLGLPALPTTGGQGSSELSSLISGSHTLRVWYSGPDKARVALLGTLGQSDVIRSGKDVWTWNSRSNTATHRTLTDTDDGPGHRGDRPAAPGVPTALPSTPQEAADLALKAIDPSTVVTTAGSARVAGRPAYELVLAPRDTASLVGQVRLAIDATEHVPVRVEVYARNASQPAVEVAFTQVSFARPDDGQFRFAPPPGVTVTEEGATPGGQPADAPKPADGTRPADGPGPGTAVIGTGWTSVLVSRAPVAAAPAAAGGPARDRDRGQPRPDDAGQLAAVLQGLPKVSGSWGSGRLLSGKLFSVLLTDDGRVLAGAVSADRLYQAAADPAAAVK